MIDAEEELDDAWIEEIERRCSAVDAGELATSDWDDFRRWVEREVFNR